METENPSGSIADPWLFGTDPEILLFSSVTFKMAPKNYFLSKLFCLLLFEAKLTSFFKVNKKSQNSPDPDLNLVLMDPNPGGPKTYEIRLLIRNTARRALEQFYFTKIKFYIYRFVIKLKKWPGVGYLWAQSAKEEPVQPDLDHIFAPWIFSTGTCSCTVTEER